MPKIDRAAIYERDGGLCGFCGQSVPLEVMHLDHYPVPRALGGLAVPENLRVAHRRCNIKAGVAMRWAELRHGPRPEAPPVPDLTRLRIVAGQQPIMLTVIQVAGLLSYPSDTVRRWCRTGALRCIMLGDRAGYRIRQDDLAAFIEARRGSHDR